MSTLRLFVDFGSTFTKVCAFDLEREALAGWGCADSTVETDVTEGLNKALDELRRRARLPDADVASACGCSSAAGGLRVACIGLTRELTGQASRLAAYGAGAKVVDLRCGALTEKDASGIAALSPDIVLLSGGTDGGDAAAVVHNAEALAAARVTRVLYCGNKSAADRVADCFAGTDTEVLIAKNVMPRLGEPDGADVNEKVRALFLEHITSAKGVDRAERIIGRVLMPTPSAVLSAAALLSDGTKKERGLGELMLVDVGGATTDVYSVCEGTPTTPGAVLAGLRHSRVLRTVEGDLGLYHNLDRLAEDAERTLAGQLAGSRGIPQNEQQLRAHTALSRRAVHTAVSRHCGTLEPVFTGSGLGYAQRGKDLTKIPALIGAGGPLVFSPDRRAILEGALRDRQENLMPEAPALYFDREYLLFAAGLLAQSDPDAALRIMKKHIIPI